MHSVRTGDWTIDFTLPPIDSVYTLSSWSLGGAGRSYLEQGASSVLLIVTKEEKKSAFLSLSPPPNPGCEWAGQGAFGASTLPSQERAQWLRVQPAQREVPAWTVHPLGGSGFPGIQGGSTATRQTRGGNEGIWEAGKGSCHLEGNSPNIIAGPSCKTPLRYFLLTLLMQHHL